MPDTNEFFITAARGHCEMSIKNTGVGKWLGRALDRLDKAEAEIERLRERATALSKLCSDRLAQRWDDNTEYRAEIQRLREALRQIITHQSLLTELADQTGASIIAREALNGGDDE